MVKTGHCWPMSIDYRTGLTYHFAGKYSGIRETGMVRARVLVIVDDESILEDINIF